MRIGEALSLTWGQIDLLGKTIIVGRAKTSSGTGRTIPISDDLASILSTHWAAFVKTFGQVHLDHYIFAYGSPLPSDPTQHVTDIKHGWERLRKRAGFPAACTISGTPSPLGLPRTAFPNPLCSR